MSETINLYRTENHLLNDAIDRVVVEIYRRKQVEGKKTYLLTGCNSGCGTTTNAINLAVALSVAGWKTLLIDCDLRKGAGYKRLCDEAEFGLSDYLSDKCELSNALYHTNYEGLDYIPCGREVDSAIRLLCTAKMEKVFTLLTDKYDFIILDAPSINAVSDAEILIAKADAVMLVVSMDSTTKRQLSDAKEHLSVYEDKYLGLLVNNVELDEYKRAIKDYNYFTKRNLDKDFVKKMKKKVK